MAVNHSELSEFFETLGLKAEAGAFYEHRAESVQDALDEVLAGDAVLMDLGLSQVDIRCCREHAASCRDGSHVQP